MIDFDLTELVDLPTRDRDIVRNIIDLAQNELDSYALMNYARSVFAVIAPPKNDILLTSTKNFDELQYSIEDVTRGIHLFRTYFAHLCDDARRTRTGVGTPMDYETTGICTVENFLNDDLCQDVIAEIDSFPLATSKNETNIISKFATGALVRVLRESPMRELVMQCVGSNQPNLYLNNTFVQRLHNRKGDGDVQKVLHSDTFFPCTKWWYFPQEVTLKDGPFTYVPGTHKLSISLCKYLVEQSIRIVSDQIEPERTYGHREGSFRIFESELKEMGYAPKEYTVPANTLVIANVFGFHKRADSISEGYRNAIHGSIRISRPFE